eukprot:469902_1
MRSLLSRVYNNNQEHVLNITVQVINTISFLSCCTVIFIYFKFKSIQSIATKLLFWISVAGLIQSLVLFLSIAGTLEQGAVCTIQAFFSQIASIASLLYSTLITIIIYKVLLNANNSSFVLFGNIDNWWLKAQIAVCVVSILSGFIPLVIPNAYGPTGGVCWIIQKDSIHQWLRFTMYYIPWILCVFVMIILSYKVTKYVYAENVSEADNSIDRVLKTIWYYPLLILCLFLFFAIRRTYELITGEPAVFILALLSLIFGHLRQLLNLIIFCFTPNVKKSLRNVFCKENVKQQVDAEIGNAQNIEQTNTQSEITTTTM